MALTHHTLVAWPRADDLFIKIHALSSQARRAGYSVAANIVEGFGRRTPRDRLHFLHMAEASQYVSVKTFSELEVEVKKAGGIRRV